MTTTDTSTRTRLQNLFDNHFSVVLFMAIAILMVLAWSNRFIQDDAFISFRYSLNLAQGKGLVWNDGYRVEGYSNFLWVLIMAVPIFLKIDPIVVSQILGVLFFGVSLVMTYRIALVLSGSKNLSLLSVVLLGTNYSFSVYASGGMETSLQTCLLTTSVLVYLGLHQKRHPSAYIVLSSLLSAAVLTRLDSLIFAVVLFAAIVIIGLKGSAPPASIQKLFLPLFGPFLVVVSSYLIWKAAYYGDLLPNSYYVKMSSFHWKKIEFGLHYLWAFLLYYFLLPFPVVFLVNFKRWISDQRFFVITILVSLWLVYIIRVGGDFMEFRFWMPILPLFCVLMSWSVFVSVKRAGLRFAAGALILAGTVTEPMRESLGLYGIETVKQLERHVFDEQQDWKGVGEALGEAFNFTGEITIATSACGAIPYYSHLSTLDILGLNDTWVAQNGNYYWGKPGHERCAPLEYLIEQKTNILLGHPFVIDRSDSSYSRQLSLAAILLRGMIGTSLPGDAQLIEIPISATRKIVVLYLLNHVKVDEAIRNYGWRTQPLSTLTSQRRFFPS